MFYVYIFLVNIVTMTAIHVGKILLYTVILLITVKFYFANTLIFLNLFNFTEIQLAIFTFIDHAFSVVSEQSSPNQGTIFHFFKW